MKKNSTWKNVLLLTICAVFALHLNIANAQDDSSTIKTSSEEPECVITDDQYQNRL